MNPFRNVPRHGAPSGADGSLRGRLVKWMRCGNTLFAAIGLADGGDVEGATRLMPGMRGKERPN